MKKYSKVRAVIFDMDGVITDTMPYHYRAWKKIFTQAGIPVGHLDIYTREGQKGIDSVYEISAEYQKKFTTAQVNDLLKSKEILFKKIVRKKYISGTRQFIKDLKKLKFKLALVTGTSRKEVCQILPKKIFDSFDVTVTGSDVHNGKPHPEPYLKALKGLCLGAKEAIVIENAPFGIESAKRAGIKTFALETSLPREYLKKADKVFDTIDALRSELFS